VLKQEVEMYDIYQRRIAEEAPTWDLIINDLGIDIYLRHIDLGKKRLSKHSHRGKRVYTSFYPANQRKSRIRRSSVKPSYCTAVLLVSLGAAVNVANADPILWTLTTLNFDSGAGIQFANGGMASGFFTYNADTNTYSDWNIDVFDFGAGFNQGNALATAATSFIQFATPQSFDLSYSSGQAFFDLFFDVPLTDSGGDVKVFANVVDAGNAFFSWQAQGTASGVVPEPSSTLLLLGGIVACALCIFLNQRRFARKGVASKSPPV